MRRYATVCLAVMLLLAGCIGGQGGTTTSPASGETTTAELTAATTDSAATDSGGDSTDEDSTDRDASAVDLYLSDEQNAMGDFAHLNVTISKVGMKRAGGGWTTHEVDDRTVDLTRLPGANATRLGSFDVENGTYETVFVHVSEVEGTLTNGEQVRVKLPSEKLQIHQSFTVGANESVDYVFDISVFKAGKSGKYILKPVISESGTDKEIEVRDGEKGDKNEERDEKGAEKDKRDDEKEDEKADELALNATFVGNVTRGENVTVSVTHNGSAVANATVSVNGETVGETADDGTLTVSVPDADEFEVEIETERGSAELEREFEESDDETTTA